MSSWNFIYFLFFIFVFQSKVLIMLMGHTRIHQRGYLKGNMRDVKGLDLQRQFYLENG